MTTTVAANPAINNKNVSDVGELMGMMGKFSIAEFNERSFSRIYHAVREVFGYTVKQQFSREEQDFDWSEFKAQFRKTFGTVEDPKLTREQLLKFALVYLGKTEDDLLELSRINYKRRRKSDDSKQGQKVDDEL